MDDPWPKAFTVVGLVTGMCIAVAVKTSGYNTGNLIVFAQAVTVLGNPLLAGSLLFLATRADMNAQQAVPLWMKTLAGITMAVVLLLSGMTAYRLLSSFFE
jgi:Mn2+/Fe2+ NRAMP family transporter